MNFTGITIPCLRNVDAIDAQVPMVSFFFEK